jgi:hypothetical protein
MPTWWFILNLNKIEYTNKKYNYLTPCPLYNSSLLYNNIIPSYSKLLWLCMKDIDGNLYISGIINYKWCFFATVDGKWGSWAAVEPCPKTCGAAWHRVRRTCDTPPPQYGGSNCTGITERYHVCGKKKCFRESKINSYYLNNPFHFR